MGDGGWAARRRRRWGWGCLRRRAGRGGWGREVVCADDSEESGVGRLNIRRC